MSVEQDALEEHLLESLRALAPPAAPVPEPPETAVIWRAQVDSRQADYAARWLAENGRTFYTIGSAGHESNAAVALALRVDDPALLHYRSGAFYLARAAQAGMTNSEIMRISPTACKPMIVTTTTRPISATSSASTG